MGVSVRTLLAVLLLAALAAAEDGLRPPSGEWVARGGSPSHSAVSSSRPLAGPVHVAWECDLGGEIEGEPLVHRSRVLVSVRTAAGKRKLVVLRLTDGGVVAEESFRASGPLLASAACGLVALRSGEREAKVLSLAEDRLDEIFAVERDKPVEALLFHEGELYLRVGGALERFDPGADRPAWRAEGAFRGEIALAGPHLYAVDFARAGGVLVTLSRAGGGRVEAEPAGFRIPGMPALDAGPHLSVDEGRAVVYWDLADDGWTRVAEFKRSRLGDRVRLSQEATRTIRGESLVYPGGSYEIDRTEGRPTLYSIDEREMLLDLADPTSRSELVAAPLRPSRSGGVGYLGARALDLAGAEILWCAPFETSRRPVPAGDFVLLVRGDSKVVAFTDRDEADFSVWVGAALLEGGCEGTVACSDGGVESGTFSVDLSAGSLCRQKGRRTEPARSLADVAAVFDADGAVLAAAGTEGISSGLLSVARAAVAEELSELALEASRARDIDLTADLVSRAIACGADLEDLSRPLRALERLRDRREPPDPNERYAEKTREKAAALVLPAPPGPVELYGLLPPDAPVAWRLRQIRRVLAVDPRHAAARAEIRDRLPDGIVPPEPFEAARWLDFVEVAGRTRVRVVEPPEKGETGIPPGRRMLGVLRNTWRPDLVALQSEQLLVVTPLVEPGGLAKCLALGELVCNTLEGFFAEGERDRSSRWPLTILLFESEGEYREQIAAGDPPPMSARVLGNSAGYYSPGEELSRMFLPDDEEAFRRVMSTFVHELTHQWIAERCPLFSAADTSRGEGGSGGFWIVEGIAEFVQDLAFDVGAGKWALRRYAQDPVAVAAAPEAALIPWPKLYAMNYAGFAGLDLNPDLRVPSPRKLGHTQMLSKIHLFYTQASATVLYLFEAEDGRYRPALMRYVGAYYRGESPSIEEFLGMPPAELGRRVREHARARPSAR